MNENAFLIIPYTIIEISELKLSEKIVLCEVISLSKNKGYCYASNRFISSRTNIKPNTVSISISSLRNKGYLLTEYKDNQRRIYINRGKFKTKTLSIFDYTLSKYDNTLSESDMPLSNYHTNKKRYKNNYNNNYKDKQHGFCLINNSEASYDIDELNKIV